MATARTTSALLLPLRPALVACALALGAASAWSQEDADASPARYDVDWTSPSGDANGSVPLGNGEVGVNAWVEANGDLVLYLSRTDSWSDNGRLLKVGRVRVTLDPPPAMQPFEERLELESATLVVHAGAGDDAATLRLWVDAAHAIVHVSLESARPRALTAVSEPWRTEEAEYPAAEVSDLMEDRSKPNHLHEKVIVSPDTLLSPAEGSIGWLHENTRSVGPARIEAIQGLAPWFEGRPDPLLHRVFGALISSPGATAVDARHLRTPAATAAEIRVVVQTAHPSDPERWLAGATGVAAEDEGSAPGARRVAHEAWWKEFWGRSWIHATQHGTDDGGDAFVVSREYALQRYVTACAGRGRYPIKFNGSIFTVPAAGRFGDADYRRWGPGYWWQNTRLPYVPLCASGDFDLQRPLFRMYVEDQLDLHRYRTRAYTGHGGVFVPECEYFFGPTFTATYGWTPYAERGEDKLQESGWHKREWVSGLELVWMLLDHYEYTQDEAYAAKVLLPMAHEVLTFFDEQFARDADGTLVLEPAQALETWWDCRDPMPEVAGLHAVTARLEALLSDHVSPEERAFWKRLRESLPPLPTREEDGVEMLAPAARFAHKSNVENPELYAVFPFRLVTAYTPDAQLGVEALHHRQDRGNAGWRQDDLFMALLGLTDEARAAVVGRARNTNTDSRFPGFFGPNYDWVPDQTHGGVLMRTLQVMLLQADGKAIHLLPAWPADWDVSFRLRAPYRTTVTGRVAEGRVVALEVDPGSRRADVDVR